MAKSIPLWSLEPKSAEVAHHFSDIDTTLRAPEVLNRAKPNSNYLFTMIIDIQENIFYQLGTEFVKLIQLFTRNWFTLFLEAKDSKGADVSESVNVYANRQMCYAIPNVVIFILFMK
jgi:hypothetical protein